MEVLLLQQLVRLEVVQTIIFARDGLFGLFTRVALSGGLFDGMLAVRRFALLCGWVSVEVGFGAVLTPSL